jgi:sec-independent protein translocase protein TatB
MFDVGFSELVLLAIVALVVLGPEKLPHVARIAGAWVGRIRRTVSSMQAEIEREVAAQEFKTRMEKELQKYGATDMVQQLQADTKAMESSLRDVQQTASAAVTVSAPVTREPTPAMPAVDVVAVADAPVATPEPAQNLLQQTTPLEQVEMDGEKAYREWLQAQKANRIAPPGLSAATATTNTPEDKPAS